MKLSWGLQAGSRGCQVKVERTTVMSGAGSRVQVFSQEPAARAGAGPGWRVHLRQWLLTSVSGPSARQSVGRPLSRVVGPPESCSSLLRRKHCDPGPTFI